MLCASRRQERQRHGGPVMRVNGQTPGPSPRWWQGAPGPRFRATTTSATYVIQDVDGQETQLPGGASPSSRGEQRGVEPPERWGHLRRGEAAEPVPSARGARNLFYPAFADAVRGTQPMPVDPWDAVATAAALAAARPARAPLRS